uniref:NADH dehydrogenase subunit 6 n=1 Tax=Hammerschmidtiella sp. ZengetLiu-2016 TaxID=2025463 RepID=A0A3S6JBX4_9BILA|nr:NADH dehydrogenase subunit 6 [Hammerschmidtiella sp. ZengetLiu-2016]
MKWFLLMAGFMSLFMYMNMDPMKGSFFLVLGLVMVAPVLSLNLHVWFAYYICLLFLSGVFVILVYFSSLSKFVYLRSPLILWGAMMIIFCGGEMVKDPGVLEGINIFYYDMYWVIFFIIIVILLLFMSFMSYFLSLGIAMRKL